MHNTYRSEGNTNLTAPNSVETVGVDLEERESEVAIGYATEHEGGHEIAKGREYAIALEREGAGAIAMGREDGGIVKTGSAA